MSRKDYLGIGTVVLVSIVVGFFILGTAPRPSASISQGHGHGHAEATRSGGNHGDAGHGEKGHSDHGDHHDAEKGPHGGRLFMEGSLKVEVVIFEEGVPPRFRVYAYNKGTRIDPKELSVSIELKRLGNRMTLYQFEPKGDFLYSDTIVQEPHSFDVKVFAEYEGKKYAWEYSQIEARAELVPEVTDTMGIEVETAGPGLVRSVLHLPGEIALNTDRVSRVIARISGVVSACAKNLGDRVGAGETIAIIDSRELADAQSRYLVHLNREKLAKINYDRTERLWKEKVSPEKEFLDAEKAFKEATIERLAAGQKLRALGLTEKDLKALSDNPEASMTDYSLKAPFDGIVITKHVSQGQWVEEKADILRIADLSTVWVDITVYPDDLDSVRVGQKATVKFGSTDLTADGVVSYVGPLVGEKSRTAKARIVIDNPHGRWRPGMFVSVQLVKDETAVPVVVKPEAVQTLERFGDAIFFRYGNHFEVRPVTLGRADSEHVEVVKGLSPGEKYASTNSFLIKAELAKSGLSHTH